MMAEFGWRGRFPVQTESPFQFTFTDLLAVTAYVAFALGMGRWSGSPVIVTHLLILLLGWGMRRFAHGHLGGIVPACWARTS